MTKLSSPYRLSTQAKFERLWLLHPEQFNPERNALSRNRLELTWNLMEQLGPFSEKTTADLGVGAGVLTQRLAKAGATVHAVDIARNALKRLQEKELPHVLPICDYVPSTSLPDNSYDLILCTELIGSLPHEEHRLLFSELARLIKKDGTLICSTALDVDSEDVLERFLSLLETEFKIEKAIFSYHALYINLLAFLKAPSCFLKAWKDPEYRNYKLSSRRGFYRRWFEIQSTTPWAPCWKLVNWFCQPLARKFGQSKQSLKVLERICRCLKPNSGISQIFVQAKKRPLVMPVPENEQPKERKGKKEVWE